MCAGFRTVATGTSERAMLPEFCKLNRPNPWTCFADTPVEQMLRSVPRLPLPPAFAVEGLM
jgi:hypothetical protein